MNRSTPEPTETLQVRSPGDLLETVPYLVGFHPAQSVVLLGLADARVVITARVDLTDCTGADRIDVLGPAMVALVGSGAQSVLAVVYDDEATTSPTELAEVLYSMFAGCGLLGLALLEALLVRSGRWWFLHELDGPGFSLPGESSTAAATATFAGLVALPDRDAMTAVLRADPPSERAALADRCAAIEDAARQARRDGRQQSYRRSVTRALFAEARESDRRLLAERDDRRLSKLTRLGVGLTDIRVRDAIWVAVDQARLDGRNLWQEMLRRLPEPYDAAPLFLFGWASWRGGNGVLASEAAQRALDSDPGYGAAELLLSALRSGLDPYRTPRLRLPRSA